MPQAPQPPRHERPFFVTEQSMVFLGRDQQGCRDCQVKTAWDAGCQVPIYATMMFTFCIRRTSPFLWLNIENYRRSPRSGLMVRRKYDQTVPWPAVKKGCGSLPLGISNKQTESLQPCAIQLWWESRGDQLFNCGHPIWSAPLSESHWREGCGSLQGDVDGRNGWEKGAEPVNPHSCVVKQVR